MLHTLSGPRRCLTDRERETLLAIGGAAIPAGKLMPAAGDRTIGKLEEFLATSPSLIRGGYRALINTLDAASYARYLRPFTRLDGTRRLALLESWRTGDVVRRNVLRALVSAIKLAHYDDADFYKALGCVYTHPPARAERPRYLDRVAAAGELEADEEVECDVVVIGTGAGGAVVARELAERGQAVILLEEGEYFTRADFGGRTVDMHRKMYRDHGGTIAIGNAFIPIPVGRTVGGTTTINSGTCFRVPNRVLHKWRDDLGLTDLTPDHLAPYFERVESVLGVALAERKYLGGVADAIARGCDALGYRHQPLRRNAPDCDGKGVCCFGCPTDAKRSTNVSYVPLALKAGAQLFTGARVDRVVVENGRATGVEATATSGHGRRLRVRARATVVACGTLMTPILLERSGLCGGSGQLGQNLSIHPAAAAFAVFDHKIHAHNAIPQGYSIEEFHDEGILFEGGTPPLDLGAATVGLLGPRFVELIERFDEVAMFGFMIEDSSRGRVRDRAGRPFITYVVNDADVARLKRGLEILARVFFAAGAKTVLPSIHGFDELRGEADLARLRRTTLHARDFDLTAFHPLGTARMGLDPARSVVGPDNQAHDVPGLFVADGSSVPSSLGVNPQLTIMALATRAAEHIDRSLS